MAQSSSIPRRRFIQTIGATGIGASVAGCTGNANGENNDSNGSTTIEMNLLSRTPEEALKNFEPFLHESGLSKDISIKIDAKSPGTLEDQYRQWLNAGRSSPDILTMDVGWSIPFIRRDQLLNLSKELSSDQIQTLKNEYNAESVDSSRGQNGDIFGVPLIMDIRSLMYRRDLAKKAGYDPDGESWGTDPMSWKTFSRIVADVQKQQSLQYGLTIPFELAQTITCCSFNNIMSQWGGAYFGGKDNLFGPIGKRSVTIDEERVLDALRMLRTFMWGHDDKHSLDDDAFAGGIISSDALGWRYTTDLDAFLNGNAFAYTVGQPAMAILASADGRFGENGLNEKLGMMPKPYGIKESNSDYQNIGGTMSTLAGYNLSVNPNSTNREAALEVIRTTMKDDFLIKWFNASGYLPAKPKLLQNKEIQSNPTLGQYMDTFSVVADNVIPRPVTPIYFQESKVISREVHDVVSRNKTPTEGMTDAKQQLQQLENKYGKQ